MGMLEARRRIITNNTVTTVLSTQDVVECSEYSQGNFIVMKYLELTLSVAQCSRLLRLFYMVCMLVSVSLL